MDRKAARGTCFVLVAGLLAAAAMACSQDEGQVERAGNPIPACDEERYVYRLPSQNVDTTQTLHIDREGADDSELNSWYRFCEGDDVNVSMILTGFDNVSAADEYIDEQVEVYQQFGDANGNDALDVDDAAAALAGQLDRVEALDYSSWPYLADGPAVAEHDGYGEREGVAGFRVFGRDGPNVIEYSVQHNKIEVLVLEEGWFALLPSGASAYVLRLAAKTLVNWPR